VLSDTIGNLFDFIPETNIVEEYLYNHAGDYPVYSGQTEGNGILGFIDSYNQQLPCVTFTTYGSAGKLFYREGKYTIGRNCMGLRPKKPYADKINLKWFSFAFQNLFYKLRIGDSEGQRSLNKLLLERYPIAIPDIDIQLGQLKKNEPIDSLQRHIHNCLLGLIQICNFTKEYQPASIIAEDELKTFVKFAGGTSGLIEEFIYENIPVSDEDKIRILTGSTLERTAMGYISANAKLKGKKPRVFQPPSVLVTRKGNAGKMTYIGGDLFAINDDVYVLEPKMAWKDKINLEWFIYEYQELFFRIVTSKSDNATFNKEYAERQIIRVLQIDYQNEMVKKLTQVREMTKKLRALQSRVENLLEYAIIQG